jgi:predicted DNA-binding transcriptional regulator AlpA
MERKQINRTLTKNELKIIREVTLGKKRVIEIAQATQKSPTWTYKLLKKLNKKGFIEDKNKEIVLQKHAFIPILAQLLRRSPQLIPVLADTGIPILEQLSEWHSVKELQYLTGIKRTVIYEKIKESQKFSVIFGKKGKYIISDIWPEIKEFIKDYQEYSFRTDPAIDPEILIRAKYDNVVLFETDKKNIDYATPTAFSVFNEYGITIYGFVDYYHFPKEKLSIKQIFIDAIKIYEDEKDFREAMFIILFYLKNKKKLRGIKHKFINTMNRALKGEKIDRFPPLNEIKEKAEVYDIKL